MWGLSVFHMSCSPVLRTKHIVSTQVWLQERTEVQKSLQHIWQLSDWIRRFSYIYFIGNVHAETRKSVIFGKVLLNSSRGYIRV